MGVFGHAESESEAKNHLTLKENAKHKKSVFLLYQLNTYGSLRGFLFPYLLELGGVKNLVRTLCACLLRGGTVDLVRGYPFCRPCARPLLWGGALTLSAWPVVWAGGASAIHSTLCATLCAPCACTHM